jgi:tellurite resistance protein TerC
MASLSLPLWAWVVFYAAVLLMQIADLKLFGKKGQHEVGIRESLIMTAVWIGVSLLSMLVSVLFTSRKAVH